jgi:hypothetical protein
MPSKARVQGMKAKAQGEQVKQSELHIWKNICQEFSIF